MQYRVHPFQKCSILNIPECVSQSRALVDVQGFYKLLAWNFSHLRYFCYWFTTGSTSRSLVYVSQHSLFLGEACLAGNRDNAVETNAHTQTHTGETERKSHGGNSQLCAVNEGQLVRMSHIPGWTKEEVGLAFLLVTQQGWVCVGRGTGWWKTIESIFFFSPGRCYELIPPAYPFGQTSRLMSFPFPPICINVYLSQSLWTRCLIRCLFTPINSQPTEWGYIAGVSIAHTNMDPWRFKVVRAALRSCDCHCHNPGTNMWCRTMKRSLVSQI